MATEHDRVVTDDDLVVVTRTETPFEADALVAILEADGLRAYAAHRRLEDIFPTLFSEDGTAVVVRADELERARTILSQQRPDD